MSIVAGVDFGTLSVRVSIFDSRTGFLGLGIGEYPLRRKKEDPDSATESQSTTFADLSRRAERLSMRRACEANGSSSRRGRHRFYDCTGRSRS